MTTTPASQTPSIVSQTQSPVQPQAPQASGATSTQQPTGSVNSATATPGTTPTANQAPPPPPLPLLITGSVRTLSQAGMAFLKEYSANGTFDKKTLAALADAADTDEACKELFRDVQILRAAVDDETDPTNPHLLADNLRAWKAKYGWDVHGATLRKTLVQELCDTLNGAALEDLLDNGYSHILNELVMKRHHDLKEDDPGASVPAAGSQIILNQNANQASADDFTVLDRLMMHNCSSFLDILSQRKLLSKAQPESFLHSLYFLYSIGSNDPNKKSTLPLIKDIVAQGPRLADLPCAENGDPLAIMMAKKFSDDQDSQDLDTFKTLLSLGLDLEGRDRQGNTLLMIAAKFGKPTLVDWLIKQGADLYAINHMHETVLDIAENGERDRERTVLSHKEHREMSISESIAEAKKAKNGAALTNEEVNAIMAQFPEREIPHYPQGILPLVRDAMQCTPPTQSKEITASFAMCFTQRAAATDMAAALSGIDLMAEMGF